MHFIHININSLLRKIDEVRYVPKITNASIIGKSETKLGKTISSSELEVDGYDLVRLDWSRRGGVLLLATLKVCLRIVLKAAFVVISEVFLFTFFYLNLSQS